MRYENKKEDVQQRSDPRWHMDVKRGKSTQEQENSGDVGKKRHEEDLRRKEETKKNAQKKPTMSQSTRSQKIEVVGTWVYIECWNALPSSCGLGGGQRRSQSTWRRRINEELKNTCKKSVMGQIIRSQWLRKWGHEFRLKVETLCDPAVMGGGQRRSQSTWRGRANEELRNTCKKSIISRIIRSQWLRKLGHESRLKVETLCNPAVAEEKVNVDHEVCGGKGNGRGEQWRVEDTCQTSIMGQIIRSQWLRKLGHEPRLKVETFDNLAVTWGRRWEEETVNYADSNTASRREDDEIFNCKRLTGDQEISRQVCETPRLLRLYGDEDEVRFHGF